MAVSTVIISFLLIASRSLKSTNTPSRFQSFLEMVVESIFGLVESVAGTGKHALAFTPLIAGFLVFITLNNWAEQLPGFHTITVTGKPEIHLVDLPSGLNLQTAFAATEASHDEEPAGAIEVAPDEHNESASEEAGHAETTADHATDEEHSTEGEHGDESAHSKAVALFRGANVDLNMTLALALISVTATQLFGVRYGGLAYFKKFFNFSSPINFFVGILELIGEFSKIMSFSFRLFGNIFAGEVLIMVISFLVPVILPVPFMAFELFVGALQAYVFAMLSLVFFNMAATEHHH